MPTPLESRIRALISEVRILDEAIHRTIEDLIVARGKDPRVFTEADEMELTYCEVDVKNLANVLERIRKDFIINSRW